jgi:hypothetical protein
MPRAQRTKSAVHEALQRRAGERPGASFSVKLDAPPQARLPPHRFHTGSVVLATHNTHVSMAIHASRALCAARISLPALAMRSPSVGVFC